MSNKQSKNLDGSAGQFTSLRRMLVHASIRQFDAGPIVASLNACEKVHSRFALVNLALAALPLLMVPLLLVLPNDLLLIGFSMCMFAMPAIYLNREGKLDVAKRIASLVLLSCLSVLTLFYPQYALLSIIAAGTLCVFATQSKATFWTFAGLSACAAFAWLNFYLADSKVQTDAQVLLAGFALVVALGWLSKIFTNDLMVSSDEADESLAHSLGVLVLKHDASGKMVETIGSLEAFSNRADITPSNIINLVHLPDRVAFLNTISVALMSQETQIAQLRMIGDNAQRISVLMNCEPSVDPSSGELNLVTTIKDISETTRLKKDLEDAQQAISQVDQNSTRFLATMSHELRTPLNAIIGFSDLLRQGISGDLTELQVEQVSDIHKAGHHLLEIVNATLDMSKIDAGKYELHWQDCNLQDIFHSAVSIVTASLQEKKVKIKTRIPKALHSVKCDEKAITQILINLLSNAVKFSHCGGEVLLAAEPDHTGFKIIVSDNGVGMSDEDCAEICKPYKQLSNDYSRQANGTGLGMAIVSGLISLQNGYLNIRSQLGKGTKIEVSIPGYEPKDEQADLSSKAANALVELQQFRADVENSNLLDADGKHENTQVG